MEAIDEKKIIELEFEVEELTKRIVKLEHNIGCECEDDYIWEYDSCDDPCCAYHAGKKRKVKK